MEQVSVYVGESEVAALEAKGEFLVVESQEVQNRRVQVVHVGAVGHGLKPSSSVSPITAPALVPPPANHMVKASM